MQLVQFVLVFLHSTYFLFDSECECPKPFIFLQVAHAVLFFGMFYSFYTSAYKKEQKKLRQQAKLDEKAMKSIKLVTELDKKPKDVNNAQIKKRI